MHRQLEAHRRVMIIAYRRYITADRALETARSTARSWFPEAPTRGTALIGNPGSRIRHLYERRDRALARLELARQALDEAQDRIRKHRRRTVYLIGHQ